MSLARCLMVQGTASSVGKSLLVTALCRIARQAGIDVAPFKAQNMSLNAAVTPDGLEIGRAQALQAAAARVVPRVEMNPILLKPEGEQRSQLVVMGRAVGHVTAASYFGDERAPLKQAIADSLTTLRREHELVIIEGAGSPAELNLKSRDLVNMHVAKLADAPVILVGDIDRGGVFAALLGTLALLDDDERARVVGLVINKFRGDPALFVDGVSAIEARSGKPVLGVVPFVRDLQLPEEDSQGLDARWRAPVLDPLRLEVVVVRLPRIANYDDLLPLEQVPDVVVRFVERPQDVGHADLVVLPGSKSTVADLQWLRQAQWEPWLRARAAAGKPILGICGGCQMLGRTIEDPSGVESPHASVPGLGLLPIATRFEREKVTAQVTAEPVCLEPTLLTQGLSASQRLHGYEIHQGRVWAEPGARALWRIQRAGHAAQASLCEGVVDVSGMVAGTLLHGILDNPAVRDSVVRTLRARRGLAHVDMGETLGQDAALERLAQGVRGALERGGLAQLLGCQPAAIGR